MFLKILSLIIKNFILNWYSKISTDDSFVNELKKLFRHITACLIIRIQKVNIEEFIINKLLNILLNHLNDFHENKKNYLSKDLNSVKRLPNIHIALKNRQNEIDYLRKFVSTLLPKILPDEYKLKVSIDLLSEILVSNVLLKGLDILAEPVS